MIVGQTSYDRNVGAGAEQKTGAELPGGASDQFQPSMLPDNAEKMATMATTATAQ